MASKERMVMEIDGLCENLGIGKNTAYKLINDGEVEAFKIGTVWKIPRSAIADYIERQCAKNRVMCKIVK